MRHSIVASLLLAPSLALASGYALPNSHPRDLGVCASGVAAQSDAAAAFALPAALARIQGPSVRLGAGAVSVGADWTDPTPGATVPPIGGPAEPRTASLSTKLTYFPTVAVSYGGKIAALGDRGWGVGLALQPFGGSIVKWPNDWAGRYRITEVDREVFSGTLTGGIEVIPQVRIGGGLVYYYTMETFKQNLWQEPFGATGVLTPGYPDATAKLGKLDGGALTYDVSFEVEPLKGVPFTLAVDYKHKATGLSMDGDGHFPLPAALQSPFDRSDQGVKQTLTIPNILNVGLVPRREAGARDVQFSSTRWFRSTTSTTSSANTGLEIVVPRHYGNGHVIRAGVAWTPSDADAPRRPPARRLRAQEGDSLADAARLEHVGRLARRPVTFAKAFSVDAAVFYAKMDKETVPAPRRSGSESPRTRGRRPAPSAGRTSPARSSSRCPRNWRPARCSPQAPRRRRPAASEAALARGRPLPFRVSGGPPPRRAASCREGSAGGRGVSMFPAWTTCRVRTSPCCRAGGPVRRAGRCGRASRARRCG